MCIFSHNYEITYVIKTYFTGYAKCDIEKTCKRCKIKKYKEIFSNNDKDKNDFIEATIVLSRTRNSVA